jgi:hypothetical protein
MVVNRRRDRNGTPTIRALSIAFMLGAAAACGHQVSSRTEPAERTVLRVDNQGFPDMNIFVLPEASPRIRLGTAIGKSNQLFVLPPNVVRSGVRSLRFIAAPIATQRGEVSDEILVTPGDTLVLVIPP